VVVEEDGEEVERGGGRWREVEPILTCAGASPPPPEFFLLFQLPLLWYSKW